MALVDEQYKSGMYICRFSEDVSWATSSPRQYICKNVTVGAIITAKKGRFMYTIMPYTSCIPVKNCHFL